MQIVWFADAQDGKKISRKCAENIYFKIRDYLR